jgi:Carbohydrate family 9 binding domain-like/Calcineurin-like phosphoesterase
MKKITGLLLFASLYCAIAGESNFTHEITTKAKPWTGKPLLDNDHNFHFAIFADNTTGWRKGVFSDAVEKVNLLQPDFAICVGDLIQGYTNDRARISREWDKFLPIVKKLDMRFFLVAGNHDIIKHAYPNLSNEWDSRFGQRYYSFTYKNVLFLVLHTQEAGSDALGEKQTKWAVNEIKKYSKAREIFVFIHKPLWLPSKKYKKSGFQAVMAAMKDRNHTVFAGHYHSYMQYSVNNQKYIRLSVTGGSRKQEFNYFDHIMWVSVRKDKRPVIACIKLDGVERGDIINEKISQAVNKIKVIRKQQKSKAVIGEYDLTLTNTYDTPIRYLVELDSRGTAWNFSKDIYEGEIQPGQKAEIPCELNGKRLPAPTLKGYYVIDGKKYKFHRLPGLFVMAAQERIPFKATKATIIIDGKLDESAWKNQPTLAKFLNKETYKPGQTATKVWISCDKKNLYLAAKCPEPDMKRLVAKNNQRDGNVWWDDNLEIFIDTNLDRKTYYHFVINPNNAVYDSQKGKGKRYNANLKSAVSKKADGWFIEMAIPWQDLNIKNPPAKQLGILFCRNRPGREKITQAPATGSPNHHVPSLFSVIELKE